ncbi:MAG: extracellular solute-binding protein [Armatimonadetes bacterium]|nr:extracellular solute-binding protein [Armatimonadota bacterium]
MRNLIRLFAITIWALCCALGSAVEPVTLRFVVWDGDEGLRVIRKVIDSFEASHPGIKVKLENVPYGMFTQKLLAQYAANVAPDVVMMEPPFFQRFAKRNLLLPLEQFYGDVPGFKIEDYYKPIRKTLSYENKLYVLPRDIAPIGLIYYNKRLFDEAGIPHPDGTWSWSFEPRPKLREKDFTWCMEQLTKKNSKGKVTQWGFVPGWMMAWTDVAVFSQGLRYVDNDENPTKLNFTDPQMVKTFQWVADITNQKHWIPSPQEVTSVLQSSSSMLFLQQKAAMFQSGIWEVPNFRKALVPGAKDFFEWDITLAPGFADPVTGTTKRAAPTGGSGYGIVSTTPHPKESWLLLQYMAGEPGMQEMARAGLAQPAIQRLAVSQPWIPPSDAPRVERYPASRILTDKAVESVVFAPTADYWPEVKGLVESKFDIIFNGSVSAKDGLTEGQKNAEQRLVQILKQQDLPAVNWTAGAIGGTLLIAGIVALVYWPDRKWKMTRRERQENRAAYWFLTPWLIGIVVFTLGPMVLSLIMSLADWDIITPAKWRGAGNFSEAVSGDPRFWKSISVTGIYSAISVPLGILVSLGLALLLNTKVKGIALFRTCFYLPSLASAVASALIWRKIFQGEGGMLNYVLYGSNGQGNFLGIPHLLSNITGSTEPANWLGHEKLALPAFTIMSIWGAGGGMIILLAGLQGIPQHYYEAAKLDGAGPWRVFRNVTFPLLTPSLFFTLITGVIGSFQTFTSAFVMTSGGPNDATRFYILHLYDQAFGNLRMGYASALAWILFLITLGFTFAQWRLNKYVFYESEAK